MKIINEEKRRKNGKAQVIHGPHWPWICFRNNIEQKHTQRDTELLETRTKRHFRKTVSEIENETRATETKHARLK